MTGTSESATYDVFISYNSKDRDEVKEIAQQLKDRGIRPWLDQWEEQPGLSWKKQLQDNMKYIKAAAVFVGEKGIGSWQNMEVEVYLDKFISQGSPVIPVLLKSATQKPELPPFLGQMHYVNFRDEKQELSPLDRLIWGITGKKPGASQPPINMHKGAGKTTWVKLPFKKKSELVDKLLACPTMSDRHMRDVVVLQLDEMAQVISRSDANIFDVTNIVSACENFADGIPTLGQVVNFFERNSLPAQQLSAFIQTLYM
jgi:hypothetical protein